MKQDVPSATAYLIARSTVLLSRDPNVGRFVPAHSAELSARFLERRKRFSRWIDHITNMRPLASALERATIPGIKLHYALRKQYLEEAARDAIKQGLRQVVVVGAGFDTLALRLHAAFPEVEFFEIDHPATQRAKRSAVMNTFSYATNLHFIAADLVHASLEDKLLSHSAFNPSAGTLFIAEGLLMYLTRQEVDRIFQCVRQRKGNRFAFTFMETYEGERIGFRNSSRMVDAWLKLRGERFKWGIERAQLEEFLESRGLKALHHATANSLRAKYLAPERLALRALAEGECICVAECI